MNRLLKPTVAGFAVLAVGMLGAYAQDDPDHAAPPQLTADRGDRSLHIEGDATALRVEVRQTTHRRRFVRARTLPYSIPLLDRGLHEVLDGTDAGPLGQVVGRLLSGYDYAAKEDGLNFEVMVFGKRGEAADPRRSSLQFGGGLPNDVLRLTRLSARVLPQLFQPLAERLGFSENSRTAMRAARCASSVVRSVQAGVRRERECASGWCGPVRRLSTSRSWQRPSRSRKRSASSVHIRPKRGHSGSINSIW